MVSELMKRELESKLGRSFEATQLLSPTDLIALNESRGRPLKLAVPWYDSSTGRWTNDPNHFCNPEKSYSESVRLHLYQSVLNFFRR